MGLINRLEALGELYYTIITEKKNAQKGIKTTTPYSLGDKIVVLGNGPSQNLFLKNRKDFTGYDILCVNSFPQYSEKEFFEIKPRYYCTVDPVMIDEERARQTGKRESEEYIGIRKVLKKVDWNLSIVTWNTNEFNIANPYINEIKLNTNVCLKMAFRRRKKLYLENRAMMRSETVAIPALFFSIVFGFKEIALFGIDHDDFKNIEFDDSGEVYTYAWHAYDKDKPAVNKIRGGVGEQFIYEVFEGYMWIFKEYLELQKLAESVQCHILNYNCKSYVDAFEKSRKYQ